MRVNQLALSQAFLPSLAKAGIHTVEQLAEQNLGELLRQPEFRSGVELYELIRELHRHRLTPFAARGAHVQTEREREMFRLRAVEGLTLAQIGERVGVTTERVRQLLKLHFGLSGTPPAVKRRPPVQPRELTISERRHMYRLARLMVMRNYHRPLTLEQVARTLASSPRQLQRAYAEFGQLDLPRRPHWTAPARRRRSPATGVDPDCRCGADGRLQPGAALRPRVPAPLWALTLGLPHPIPPGKAPRTAGGDRRMIGSLLSVNHIIDALLAVSVCLEVVLAVIRARKRRLEKLLERLEEQDGE